MTKIIFDEFKNLIKNRKKYFDQNKKTCLNKINDNYYKIKLKLLNTSDINSCKKIIDEEFNNKIKTDEDCQKWASLYFYFCKYYYLYIFNDNEYVIPLYLEENIFNLSVEKLNNILIKSNKKYLTLYAINDISSISNKILEIENDELV